MNIKDCLQDLDAVQFRARKELETKKVKDKQAEISIAQLKIHDESQEFYRKYSEILANFNQERPVPVAPQQPPNEIRLEEPPNQEAI